MSKKKNLLNLFTQDTLYNYHIISNEEPTGHLIYLMNNSLKLDKDSLEFSSTKIIEELIKNCSIIVEKFAPAIFFTDESNTENLKEKLNTNFSESTDFSVFIESIKDEYRILEIKDSLLYKKDPVAYENAKKEDHAEKQKESWDKMISQLEEKKKKREDYLLAYNNDLSKLLKEYLDSVIEYEKNDFNFNSEIEKIVSNLIDEDTWIKIDEKPFSCKINVISLEKEKLNVFLSDNINSYTATLRLDKTILITENVVKIEKNDKLPEIITDYNFLSELYSVDLSSVDEWEFKNDSDRLKYVIDYLVPIFKEEKDKKEKEFVEKILKEESDTKNIDNN